MELLHTCYRIGDIDRSVRFYEALGFEERRRLPIRDEAVNVFLGLPGDGDRLELMYNFGVDSYDLGTGYNPGGLRPPSPSADASVYPPDTATP
jgi:lactoylglutathione lyase